MFNGEHWIFQQDSAPAHKAKSTQQWLETNVPEFIKANKWPSGSPDLNLLDYSLWAYLEEKVCYKRYHNLDKLKSALVRAMKEIPLEKVRATIDQWPERTRLRKEPAALPPSPLGATAAAMAGGGEEGEQPNPISPVPTEYLIGSLEIVCPNCSALHFPGETVGRSCCHQGKVSLPGLSSFPYEIQELMTSNSVEAKYFQTNIRSYNSSLAFASMGAQVDVFSGRGPFCYRIHGKIYHLTGPLHPHDNRAPSYAQLYILDSKAANNIRIAASGPLARHPHILTLLDSVLRRVNPYTSAYRQMLQVEKDEEQRARIENRQMLSGKESTALQRIHGSTGRLQLCGEATIKKEIYKATWESTSAPEGYPSYDELITFLENYARSLANLRLRETSRSSPEPNKKVYSHATSVSRPNSKAACTPCMLCKNSHLLSKCQLFQNKSLQERWRFVRDNGLCYNCFRSNHLVYACKLTAVCGVCKLRHHTLLHAFTSESHDSNSLPGAIHAVESSNANRVDSSVRSNVNYSARINSVIQTHSINHSSYSSQILLSTALIRVNDLCGNSCMARALVDTVSQRTLITDSLRKTLNLPVNYSDAFMYGIGDNCLEKPLGEVDITFSPHYSNMLFTAKALILNKITCNLPNFVMERSRWPHLVGLRLADPTFDKPAPIDIIIGADIAPSLYTGQVMFQNERGPTACNSKLGWLLSGKIMAQQSDGSLHHSVLTFCATSIDNQLRKFWEFESIPPCTQPILTKEEIDCEQHFKTNVLRTTTGRYQVSLPFRVTPNFGNSKRVALRRFLSLENGLLKSEQLYCRYKLLMKEYSSLNHMQIISAVDIPRSRFRVVFDASACSDDSPSLNKALHIGPKLKTDIFDLLLRFRTFFVALSADIEKMYRQILIHPDDTCAPYLAIRTLHQLADDKAMNYRIASEIVKRDFYVDDLLTGADTVEEAQVLIRQIIALLAEGGFPIRNSPKILDFLPKDQRGINQSFDFKDLPSVKLLGILWDPSLDSFTIRVKPPDIQVLSLLRLELCSALLLANLFVAVKESLRLHFGQIFLWSDTAIALNWIKSESKRWKTFVANRVSAIQRKTSPHSWFHVPGSENPADLATRGLTPAQLVDNQWWWQGPHWLQDPSVNSYIDLPPSDELSPETLIEERSTILVYHSILGPMPELLLKYSSWIKTVDIMTFCLRFTLNCKSTDKSLNRFLSASEIHNATVKIIILIQNQEITQDIGWLRNKGSVSGKINLRFLNPFLDAGGILRVGGRLQHLNIDYNQKHPIILPKRHHYNIIYDFSEVSCKAAVKRVLNQCITCFKHRSGVVTQIMGELPLERVVPSRPFQRVGVDLAGPIITKPMLKRSKILFKTYIVLFICFTTKAIHLEAVSDLTTEAFIATLRRFTSRRGLPSDRFSDNATNFKLANRVLLDFNRELNIQNFCAQRGIRWPFIPPSAPHFGGLWEAAIPDEVVDNLSHISLWKFIQSMKNSFWKKWSQDYLNLLQVRPRWHKTHQDLQSGQLVLMKQDSTPPHHWPLARIIKTYKGPDGHIQEMNFILVGLGCPTGGNSFKWIIAIPQLIVFDLGRPRDYILVPRVRNSTTRQGIIQGKESTALQRIHGSTGRLQLCGEATIKKEIYKATWESTSAPEVSQRPFRNQFR
ncbi:hypothetical protein LAZ67_21001404 [Cordylochernes scorpioides]|uniref:Integrase catalytic domain-containing protein n=1 Tax=Cordylochernes scorpioides TaxID=51811 RepID=A0ABY6LPJ9_9ARAC|nr:hypothetical protein LAZ67_21001404 [Cordylochernes scorpioides]